MLNTIIPELSNISDSDLLGKINGVENRLQANLEQDQLRLQSTDPRPPGTICNL